MTIRHGERAGADPWDAATLEWAIPSPPPVYNFAVMPTVTHRDQLWWDKYGDEHGHAHVSERRRADHGRDSGSARMPAHPHVHLPNPSYFPLLAALGLFIFALGLLFHDPVITIGLLHLPIIAAAGMALLIISVYAWAFEPAG